MVAICASPPARTDHAGFDPAARPPLRLFAGRRLRLPRGDERTSDPSAAVRCLAGLPVPELARSTGRLLTSTDPWADRGHRRRARPASGRRRNRRRATRALLAPARQGWPGGRARHPAAQPWPM